MSNPEIIGENGMVNSYHQMQIMSDIEKQNTEKQNKLIERVKRFETITTLEDAKDLMSKILPVASEKTVFTVGSARCTVVNKEDNLRICIDTPQEFIAYDFV